MILHQGVRTSRRTLNSATSALSQVKPTAVGQRAHFGPLISHSTFIFGYFCRLLSNVSPRSYHAPLPRPLVRTV